MSDSDKHSSLCAALITAAKTFHSINYDEKKLRFCSLFIVRVWRSILTTGATIHEFDDDGVDDVAGDDVVGDDVTVYGRSMITFLVLGPML